MITAEKFMTTNSIFHDGWDDTRGRGNDWTNQTVKEALIEFAKLHVQEALKQADINAKVTPIDHEEISEGSFRPIWGVDSSSILNAYPLENIK